MPKTKQEAIERPEAGDAFIYGPQWQLERFDVTGSDKGHIHGLINGRPAVFTVKEWKRCMVGSEYLGGRDAGE